MPTVLTISGNRDFRPETSIAVDAGYRIEFKRLSFDLSAFRYAYHDLRSLELGAPQMHAGLPFLELPGTLGNGSVGTSSGAELATVIELPGGSRLSASYSGLFSDVHHQPVSQVPSPGGLSERLTPLFKVTETYSPRNQWQVNWQTGLPRKVRLNLWVAHVGPVTSSGTPAQQQVPAYTRVDTQLSRSIWEGGELQSGMQNMQSAHHLEFLPETQSVPSEIPRTFYVRLTWRF
jgi:outer membrane receptor protein involved in Fe transport